LRVTTTE